MKYTLEQFKKFAKEIEAYENGEDIEIYDMVKNIWVQQEFMSFYPSMQYRIKESPREEWIPFGVEDWDLIRDAWVMCSEEITTTKSIQRINGINFDSETILIGADWITLKCSFTEYTFEDGKPFGKLKL